MDNNVPTRYNEYNYIIPSDARGFSPYNYILSFYKIEWGYLSHTLKNLGINKPKEDFLPTFILENNLLGKPLDECHMLLCLSMEDKDYI